MFEKTVLGQSEEYTIRRAELRRAELELPGRASSAAPAPPPGATPAPAPGATPAPPLPVGQSPAPARDH